MSKFLYKSLELFSMAMPLKVSHFPSIYQIPENAKIKLAKKMFLLANMRVNAFLNI